MFGCYLGLSSVVNVRFLAPLGFDAFWIDWEHSSCNVETMTDMVHETIFMSEGRTIPWVRVPGHDHAAIGYALDAGASIVVPQVNTVEDARHVVSAAKYGARRGGTRSAPPFRLIPGLTDVGVETDPRSVHERVNDQAALMIQIETMEGIENLDEILTQVEGIDAVWLGTLDLRVSMGLPGMTGEEPEFVAAQERFAEILRKHDKPRGGLALGPPEAMMKTGKDNSLSFVAADVMALGGLAASLGPVKELFPAERKMRGGSEKAAKVTVNGHKQMNGHAEAKEEVVAK